jgi:hypothetical protein
MAGGDDGEARLSAEHEADRHGGPCPPGIQGRGIGHRVEKAVEDVEHGERVR